MAEINTESQSFDAQQIKEEIAQGDRPAPQVDTAADSDRTRSTSAINSK
jgi:hypothetical protein